MTLGSPISEVWENFSPTISHEHFTNYNQIQQNNKDVLAPKDDYQVPITQEPEKQLTEPKPKPEVKEQPTLVVADKNEVVVNGDISEKQNLINESLHKKIISLENKINELLQHIKNDNKKSVDLFGKNIHDILLFVILGIFMLLVLDAIYRIIKMKVNKNI